MLSSVAPRVSAIGVVWQQWYQSQGYSELVFLKNLDYNRFWLENEVFKNKTQRNILEKKENCTWIVQGENSDRLAMCVNI